MSPTIVVAEEIAPAGVEALAAHGTVVDAAGWDRHRLREALAGADALVVRSATQVDADLLAAGPNLQVVGRAGIGVDNIDLAAATAAGVMVVNAPAANIVSAAEHTLALLLAQARNVAVADASIRAGRWDRAKLKGVELNGKTLGIIGFGRIGKLVAGRAKAFGMDLITYDPYVAPESGRRLGVEVVGLDELFARSDFITVHLPKTKETAGLLGADAFGAMKDGARIVNTSRGGIIDEQALVDAVRAGKVGGAGLDVYDAEPLPDDSPLRGVPEIVLTPHLGASTTEAQDRAGIDVADAVVAALSGELVASAVNLDVGPPADLEVSEYLPLVERLGSLFVSLARGIPSQITLRVGGQLAEHPVGPLRLALLKGGLGRVSSEHVTYVNAGQLGDAQGVKVVTETSDDAREFVSLVEITGTLGERSPSVTGTVTGKGPTLVGIDDMEIELPLGRNMLVVRHADKPGAIGKVATFLGNVDVNIANMVVGRNRVAGEPALMGLDLDQPLTEAQVDELRAIDGIEKARFLQFGP
jgi:D-3-phosphoglycerate dehydrogenase